MNTIRNKSILVVDDEPQLLRALGKVLTDAGAVVTCVEHGDDAIDILNQPQTQLDLLITDLRVPTASGLTIISAVNKVFPRPAVVVLTAFASPYIKEECFRQGAAAFLEKPVDSQNLVSAITKVLHSRETAL